MNRFRLSRLSSDALPKVALTGLVLAIAAFAIGAFALVRVTVVSGQKADKAGAEAKVAQRTAAVAVCALANAQRSGNTDAPPPSTDRGVYVAAAWQVTYESLGCKQFTKAELDAVVKTPAPGPSSLPTSLPPTPGPTLGPTPTEDPTPPAGPAPRPTPSP